ncbi:IS3 family transposase, partial [Cryobacterium sp. 10I5]|nr:IS3 family transposase [Cryobacterium sp. 10I5]
MTTYRDLTGHGVPTRTAAALVGLPRATATRTSRTPVARRAVVPANRLDVLERARILAVVNSARFVDLPPIQIYAQLLDEGVYLASIS